MGRGCTACRVTWFMHLSSGGTEDGVEGTADPGSSSTGGALKSMLIFYCWVTITM